jgi:hypothetical protein
MISLFNFQAKMSDFINEVPNSEDARDVSSLSNISTKTEAGSAHRVEELDACDSFEFNNDLCDMCFGRFPAVIACEPCLMKLCDIHQKAHMLSKLTTNHELLSLDQLNLDQVTALDENQVYITHQRNCTVHLGEIANKYCIQCKTLCCVECESSANHYQHDIRAFKAIRTTLIQGLEKKVGIIQGKIGTLLEMKYEIQKWEKRINNTNEDYMSKLAKEYEECRNQIEKQFQEAKEYLSQVYSNSNHVLDTKKTKIDEKLRDLDRLGREYPLAVKSDDPYEFALKKKDFEEIINEIEGLQLSDIFIHPSSPEINDLPTIYPFLKSEKVPNQHFTKYHRGNFTTLHKYTIDKELNAIVFDLDLIWFKYQSCDFLFEPVEIYCTEYRKNIWQDLTVVRSEDSNSFLLMFVSPYQHKVHFVEGSMNLKYAVKGQGQWFDLEVRIQWQC